MFETYLTVVGRVITDVQQRTVSTGDRVCWFRMASTERRYDKEQQRWVDGNELFIQVKCWRRLAESVPASLFKGDPVVVTGRLYVREYEMNGEQKSMIELEAQAIGPNLALCSAMVQRQPRDAATSEIDLTESAAAA
jgi:single-strand DNA-binding protein